MTSKRILLSGLLTVLVLWGSSCGKGPETAADAERAKVIELAKAEFYKSGMSVKDHDVTAEEQPKAGKWTVWFEQKGEFPVPGGRHLVEVELDTGKAVFMRGE